MKKICLAFVLAASLLQAIEPPVAIVPVLPPEKSLPASELPIKQKDFTVNVSPYVGVVLIFPTAGVSFRLCSQEKAFVPEASIAVVVIPSDNYGLRVAGMLLTPLDNGPELQFYFGVGGGCYADCLNIRSNAIPIVPLVIGVQRGGFRADIGIDVTIGTKILPVESNRPQFLPIPTARIGWSF